MSYSLFQHPRCVGAWLFDDAPLSATYQDSSGMSGQLTLVSASPPATTSGFADMIFATLPNGQPQPLWGQDPAPLAAWAGSLHFSIRTSVPNEDPGLMIANSSLAEDFPGKGSDLTEMTVMGWLAVHKTTGDINGQANEHFWFTKGGSKTALNGSFTTTPAWFLRKTTETTDTTATAGLTNYAHGTGAAQHLHGRIYFDDGAFVEAYTGIVVPDNAFLFVAMTYSHGLLTIYTGQYGEELQISGRGSISTADYDIDTIDLPVLASNTSPFIVGGIVHNLSGTAGQKLFNNQHKSAWDEVLVFSSKLSFQEVEWAFKRSALTQLPAELEQETLKRVHAEVIFSPTEPGVIENDQSEIFTLASKYREDRGGIRLELFYDDLANTGSPFPRVRLTLQDPFAQSVQLTSDSALLYNAIYYVDGFIDVDKNLAGILIYELTKRGWAEVESQSTSLFLNGIGLHQGLSSTGYEWKNFFSRDGYWSRSNLLGRRALYRFSPASPEVSGFQPSQEVLNELVPSEKLVLSDRTLTSPDTPYNTTSVNLGRGVITDAGTTDTVEGTTGNLTNLDRYVEIAPFIKRFSAESVTINDLHLVTSRDSATFESLPDHIEATDGTTFGPGPFVKDVSVNRMTFHDQQRVTIMGFVKPEENVRTTSKIGGYEHQATVANKYNLYNGSVLGTNSTSYGNPVGLDFPSNRSFYGALGNEVIPNVGSDVAQGSYNVYLPQTWKGVTSGALWTPQAITDVGQEYLDYPSFRIRNTGAANNIFAAYQASNAASEISFFRTIYSNSNNGGQLSFLEDMRWGHRWIGLGLISVRDTGAGITWGTPYSGVSYGWEYFRRLSVTNSKEEVLNDQVRFNIDRSLYGLRRFLVSECSVSGLQTTTHANQSFIAATWPFERIRFSKIYRCAFGNDNFVPWTGQTIDGTARSASGFEDLWVNNSKPDLEGFPFLMYHRTPPTQGVVVGYDVASPPPKMSTSIRDAASGTSSPSASHDSNFRSMPTPALLVCMYATLDGDVAGQASLQTQPLRSTPDDRVDHVFQTLEISAIPRGIFDTPIDTASNQFLGKYNIGGVLSSGTEYPHSLWQFYCLSIDLENQRAFVGWAPVPAAGVADENADPSFDLLGTMFDTTSWVKQDGVYVLGHSSAVSKLDKKHAGPDWGLVARVFKYGVEYDFRFMEPDDQPAIGHHRKRLLIGAQSAISAGLKIWNPETIEGVEAKNQLMSMLDPGYIPFTTYNAMDDSVSGHGGVPFPASSQENYNMVGDIYPKSTTVGSGPEGHENSLLRGKIGEHLILEDLYVNGDGQQLVWPNYDATSATYKTTPSTVTTDLDLEVNENAVPILDLLPQLAAKVRPNLNWQHITELGSSCSVASVRIHREDIIDEAGALLEDKAPAGVEILGIQPHYDLDTETTRPRDRIVVHTPSVDTPPVLSYQYGVAYEPPIGRIIQGVGHNEEEPDYIAAINPFVNTPAVQGYDMSVGHYGIHPFHTVDELVTIYRAVTDTGRMLSLGLSMIDNDLGQNTSVDTDIAAGVYDAHHEAVGQALVILNKPVYIDVGMECNSTGKNHVADFIPAYKKVRTKILEQGFTKATWVCSFEITPATPTTDIANWTSFYPGDDVVDWLDMHIFTKDTLTPGQSKYTKYQHFMDWSRGKNKPMFIRESNPAGDAGADAVMWEPSVPFDPAHPDFLQMSDAVWDYWHVPYYNLLYANQDVIKGAMYVGHNFNGGNGGGSTWHDTRRQLKPAIMGLSATEYAKDQWLNFEDGLSLLNGYSAALAS